MTLTLARCPLFVPHTLLHWPGAVFEREEREERERERGREGESVCVGGGGGGGGKRGEGGGKRVESRPLIDPFVALLVGKKKKKR